MQEKTEVDPHGILADINLMSFAHPCVSVGYEMMNNVGGSVV